MDGHDTDSSGQPGGKPPVDDQDDFEAASHSTADYAKYMPELHERKHTGRIVLIILLVLLLLAGVGAAVYWFVLRPEPAAKPAQNTQKQSAQSEPEEQIATKTKHYASNEFVGLEFDYPENWAVTETAGSGQLVARSPSMDLTSADGETVNGQVVFTIRNKQQALPEFDGGNAVAARTSEKIDYTKPSTVQRGSTYISFLRYAKTTDSKALDGVYVTGDVGYQAAQAIPKADFTPVDPVISLTFAKCADSKCSGSGTPLAIAATSWDATAKQLKSMLQSLIVN